MGSPVDRAVVMEDGLLVRIPPGLIFNKFIVYFKSEGWWLFNKKLQIIVISLPQDSLLFVHLCLSPIICDKQVAKLVVICRRDPVRILDEAGFKVFSFFFAKKN